MRLHFGLLIALYLFVSTVSALTISSIFPNSGLATGGNTATITGTGLAAVDYVDFGGYQATIQSKNSMQVVVTVPDAQTWGSVDVEVSDVNDYKSRSSWYTYLTPTIDSVLPNQGPMGGGTNVIINGSNFTNDINDISFDGNSASSFAWISPTQISAITPDSGGTAGMVNIDFYVNAGTVYGLNQFTYLAPTINTVSPSQGPEVGGTSVTLTGNNFVGITDVQFNMESATSFTVVDDNTITAIVPDSQGTIGLVNVGINTNTNSYMFTGAYTYLAAPSIISISPNSGNTYGGIPITITASNLIGGAAATINGIPLTGATTATTITGTTPPLPVGVYAVVVTNPDGQIDTRVNGFTVSLSPALALTSINPNTVDARGGITVIITGNNFVAGTTATINGTALTSVSVDSSTTITATIPALAEGVYDLVVTTPDAQQIVTLSNAFTVTSSPEFIAGDLAPRGAPDGQLNVGDLVIMHRFINELETPTTKELLIADVAPLSTPDIQLNVADALLLQRAILGEITLSNVIDNQSPQISIISPVNNSYTTANTMTITGMLDEPGTLTINGTAVTVDALFTFLYSINLQEGVNTIALVATDIYSNNQTQNLIITKDTQAPAAIDASRLSLSEVVGQTTVAGLIGSVEAGATVSIVANGQTTTVTANANGSFNALITASNGDLVQLTVIDNASNNSNILNYTVGAILQILSPLGNSTINAEMVNIVGLFADENNSGINVNGETACTYGNNFYVNNLALTTEVNTLTATYTTESGGTQNTSINVARSGAASYKLSANKNCGMAPLDVSFDLDTGNSVIQQVDVDYDNDGVIDLTTTTPATAILQYNYTTAGVYPVTAWVTTATGVQQLSLNIVVNDVDQQNTALKAVWSNMQTALIAGDKSTAMQYITPKGRKTYGPVFDSLMPHMAEIYGELSGIEQVNISNEIANYAVIRLEGGIIKAYMINFSKGNNGVWRVDSM